MRLHIDDMQGDDLEKARLCMNVEIWFNGRKEIGVIMADEELGVIERYVPSGDARWALVADGVIATETLYGKVEIREMTK